jgi:hypothetical protein
MMSVSSFGSEFDNATNQDNGRSLSISGVTVLVPKHGAMSKWKGSGSGTGGNVVCKLER